MRLFVALEVPSDVRVMLARCVDPFRGAPSVRWVPEANYHLTLGFVGQVPGGEVDGLSTALSDVARGAVHFRTAIARLGSFPVGAQRARVLVAGVDDKQGRIADIEALVRASFSAWLPQRQGPYVPHVTLGRCVPPTRSRRGGPRPSLPERPFPSARSPCSEATSDPRVRSMNRCSGLPSARSCLRSNTCSGKVRGSTRLMTGV
ncbi:MAG: 2,3-cyclic 3-phosphodiesterase [Actinomycetota bacterium]|jgi:2'-5' RNA ligase|nr:2,3-cyclic 3-phosphodiesterase [Actinomycetota bacterium]